MKRVSEILEGRASILLATVGLGLIVVGNVTEVQILKVKLGELLAEVGALLLIVGIMHWIYETTIRRQLIQEIMETVVGAGRISASGIADFTINSRLVDYNEAIEKSRSLTIGEHYSARLFEDYAPAFAKRQRRGGETTVLLLWPGSSGETYLKEYKSWQGGARSTIGKIREIGQPNTQIAQQNSLKIKWHRRVLRYSFIMTEEYVWVILYTTSGGHSLVPALRVAQGSPLYSFFADDIEQLVKEAEDDRGDIVREPRDDQGYIVDGSTDLGS